MKARIVELICVETETGCSYGGAPVVRKEYFDKAGGRLECRDLDVVCNRVIEQVGVEVRDLVGCGSAYSTEQIIDVVKDVIRREIRE